jgi:hypothetical protein
MMRADTTFIDVPEDELEIVDKFLSKFAIVSESSLN